MIRKAVVAGHFYPAPVSDLVSFLQCHLRPAESRLKAKAIVVPHAGYPYSGPLAAEVFSKTELPRRFVILCPNHTGLGASLAVMSEGAWETPLGLVEIDHELAQRLKSSFPLLEESSLAHRDEHSLEVQLPFLQHLLSNDFRFVPICVAHEDFDNLVALGRALGRTIESESSPVLVVSSSDMNHFESAEATIRKDELAIARVLELDSRGLYDVVWRNRISMCGYAPTVAAIEAAKVLNASRGVLIGHTHSGVVTGDNQRVVGYAGIALC